MLQRSCCFSTHISPKLIPVARSWTFLSQNLLGHVELQPHQFSTTARTTVAYKIKDRLKEYYTLLNVSEEADVATVKEAFVKSAKLYHPDSGASTADAVKFTEVKEAYRAVLDQKKFQDDKEAAEAREEEVEKIVFDIKHTAPQHRQYLTFDGIGSGTPTDRMKTYQQYRVAKAADNVHDYRIQRVANLEEAAVVVRDKQEAKKVKISNAIERLVEDLIQDSMNKGDFDNLAGKGKPLSYENRNPLIDTATHNLNKVLISNGFAPEWIMLQGEIRKDITDARRKLAILRSKMGDPPFSPEDTTKWQSHLWKHRITVNNVNEKIDKFNMIVPFLDKQMVRYDPERDIKRITDYWEKYLPECQEDTDMYYNANFGSRHPHFQMARQKVNWVEVWMHIKEVFRSRS